ncbi:MAG TPA: glucose-1-phosphate thymidylyltransferase, partial [Thermoplasmatales archaeon]|nr:glucose-1-phosphate thymidylyltransferase [Thermoplasmatales archaeon]
MQAVILAGGFGTRLAPLTYTRAKPMLPILNKPMLHHLIDSLPQE